MTKSNKLSTVFLTAADIPAVLALQKEVHGSLVPEESHFLKLRSEYDIRDHMATAMPVIGIKDRVNLAAMVFLTYPDRLDDNSCLEGYPVTGPAITAVIRSLCVHPDWSGLKLGTYLLHAAINVSLQRGYNSFLAKVAQKNTKSFRIFCETGFQIATTGFDPAKGYAVNYLTYTPLARQAQPPYTERAVA